MNGGNVTAPEFAFWSADNGGEWIVENHGVDPDYVVAQRPDLVVSGHDPQLEKAIELAKEALRNYKGLPPAQVSRGEGIEARPKTRNHSKKNEKGVVHDAGASSFLGELNLYVLAA